MHAGDDDVVPERDALRVDEVELLERAARHGVTLEDRADGGCNVLGIGGGLWYRERRLALSFLADWLRRAHAFERPT